MAARRAAGDLRGPWVAVAGTRPNFVKLAPLVRAARARGRRLAWIHTGQHTQRALSASMCRDLALPAPLAHLRAPPAGPARLGSLAVSLGRRLERLRPSLVVVLGDVDSTLAAAVAAWRLDLPLVHVEAGLRSGERDMPEERNRVLADALSDRLYLSEPEAAAPLRAEGVSRARIRSPGNVMADALRLAGPEIRRRAAALDEGGPFALATFHRQALVDDPARLARLAGALARVADDLPVVFPVHPRTRARLERGRHAAALARRGVLLSPPLPYLAFLARVSRAAAVLTDSGGLQVEAALLQVPCVTLRRRTEHRLTLRGGRNRVIGADPRRLPAAVRRALGAGRPPPLRPRAWDGRAAERIVDDWCRGFARPRRLPGLAPRTLAALGLGG